MPVRGFDDEMRWPTGTGPCVASGPGEHCTEALAVSTESCPECSSFVLCGRNRGSSICYVLSKSQFIDLI